MQISRNLLNKYADEVYPYQQYEYPQATYVQPVDASKPTTYAGAGAKAGAIGNGILSAAMSMRQKGVPLASLKHLKAGIAGALLGGVVGGLGGGMFKRSSVDIARLQQAQKLISQMNREKATFVPNAYAAMKSISPIARKFIVPSPNPGPSVAEMAAVGLLGAAGMAGVSAYQSRTKKAAYNEDVNPYTAGVTAGGISGSLALRHAYLKGQSSLAAAQKNSAHFWNRMLHGYSGEAKAANGMLKGIRGAGKLALGVGLATGLGTLAYNKYNSQNKMASDNSSPILNGLAAGGLAGASYGAYNYHNLVSKDLAGIKARAVRALAHKQGLKTVKLNTIKLKTVPIPMLTHPKDEIALAKALADAKNTGKLALGVGLATGLGTLAYNKYKDTSETKVASLQSYIEDWLTKIAKPWGRVNLTRAKRPHINIQEPPTDIERAIAKDPSLAVQQISNDVPSINVNQSAKNVQAWKKIHQATKRNIVVPRETPAMPSTPVSPKTLPLKDLPGPTYVAPVNPGKPLGPSIAKDIAEEEAKHISAAEPVLNATKQVGEAAKPALNVAKQVGEVTNASKGSSNLLRKGLPIAGAAAALGIGKYLYDKHKEKQTMKTASNLYNVASLVKQAAESPCLYKQSDLMSGALGGAVGSGAYADMKQNNITAISNFVKNHPNITSSIGAGVGALVGRTPVGRVTGAVLGSAIGPTYSALANR